MNDQCRSRTPLWLFLDTGHDQRLEYVSKNEAQQKQNSLVDWLTPFDSCSHRRLLGLAFLGAFPIKIRGPAAELLASDLVLRIPVPKTHG
jgi:hypothetical protein